MGRMVDYMVFVMGLFALSSSVVSMLFGFAVYEHNQESTKFFSLSTLLLAWAVILIWLAL